LNKMKAVVYRGPERLAVEEVDVPEISSQEVLVKVKAAGVCGTDVRIYHGRFRVPVKSGRIIGHEFSGDIVEVGKEVEGLAVGMRVTVRPIMHCGRCLYCLQGRTNICLSRPTLGYEYDGAFAEYVRIPVQAIRNGNVFELPENLSYEEAAITEPLAACVNGAERSNIKPGDTVVIVGGGPIGLMHLQLAKLYGAGRVIVSEIKEERLKVAEDFGADLTVNPLEEDLVNSVKNLTQGYGADVAIVAVGAPTAIEQAIRTVRKGGTVNLFGGCPTGSSITIDPNIIHYGELIVTGTSGSTPYHHWKAVRLASTGQVKLRPLITHVLPLEKAVDAISMKERGEGLKHVLKP